MAELGVTGRSMLSYDLGRYHPGLLHSGGDLCGGFFFWSPFSQGVLLSNLLHVILRARL